jgi:predicted phage baseplate assembly protein
VVEIERDNSAFLRFGDGQYGAAPDPGLVFTATYRIGNGAAGNIGRDSLGHIVLSKNQTFNAQILQVRNPLPAAGGIDPESMEHIRQQAPYSFQTQLRAVTEDDYGAAAAQQPGVREARGTLRWTGSWYTAFVSLDPAADGPPDPKVLADTSAALGRRRMAGVDLEIESAIIVGLRIEMTICVDLHHFRGDVEQALMKVFTSGNQCTGQPGVLNPANFSFGQTIYASPLVAAAQAVEGVTSATLSVFERMDAPGSQGLDQGFLTMGRTDIARCDNIPDRLDRGIFVPHMDGGK